MLKKLCFMLLILYSFLTVKAADDCQTIITKRGTGTSESFQPDSSFDDVLTEALTSAIAQVHGAFVSVRSTLVEQTQKTSGTLNEYSEVTEEITREVSETFGGFILGFRIVNEPNYDSEVYFIEVEADICADPRIAISVVGSASTVNAFLTAFRETVEKTAWKVTPISGLSELPSSDELIAVSAKAGATLIARVVLSDEKLGSEGTLPTTTLDINAEVYDIRTFDMELGFSSSETVRTVSPERALKLASDALGSQLATKLIVDFLPKYPTSTRTSHISFTFSKVHRVSTQFNLFDSISNLPGVVRVVDPRYLHDEGQVHVQLEAWRTPCYLASALERSLRGRLQIRLISCSDDSAYFSVDRE